ncbi:ComF family protein [Paenibacillus fonticola]|uniref:ComF family protein n=1 Tax=Paenibacillus fonticola TaxID=379896 RepID=UPI000369D235|nr:hypothetical protein [Paenibacillus fonticola]
MGAEMSRDGNENKNSYWQMEGQLDRIWSNLLTPIHRLLAPAGSACLVCGKTIKERVPGYPELCLLCFSAIPWITRPRCRVCGRLVGCPDCSRSGGVERCFIMNRSSVAYSASMRNWLAQYKYRGHEAYGAILARMIGRAIGRMMQELHELHELNELNEHKAVHPFFDAVTYVPLSEERWRERGFNQAEVLAKGAVLAGKRLGGRLPVVGLLRRSRHTDKQSFKSRHERLHNMQGVFQALPEAVEQLAQAISPAQTYFRRHSPSHRRNTIRLLLVDDVYTTGSTLNACAAVLQHICRQLGMPGEIYSLTWARS